MKFDPVALVVALLLTGVVVWAVSNIVGAP